MTTQRTTETQAKRLRVGDYIRFNANRRQEVIEVQNTGDAVYVRILDTRGNDEWIQSDPDMAFYKFAN